MYAIPKLSHHNFWSVNHSAYSAKSKSLCIRNTVIEASGPLFIPRRPSDTDQGLRFPNVQVNGNLRQNLAYGALLSAVTVLITFVKEKQTLRQWMTTCKSPSARSLAWSTGMSHDLAWMLNCRLSELSTSFRKSKHNENHKFRRHII